jgi:(p)ppGpp synthase/HD superfamily hydrolase
MTEANKSRPALGFRFEMALVYAFHLHGRQTRKGGTIPYIGHLLGVASTVIEAGGDEDLAIAALLHDTVEDQGVTLQEIDTLFGARVARIVSDVSDLAPEGEERTAANWRWRKERYLAHLRESDRDALLVSLADKLYNARAILHDLRSEGASVWDRFNQPREQQLWYYRELADAFRGAKAMSNMGAEAMILLRELELVVAELGA